MSGAYRPQEIIRKKRDGGILSDDEIAFFVAGLTDGSLADAQVAAFAMAVFFNGMTMDERVALTNSMTGSGVRLAWPELDGPVADKHSTGGVGDKVSLILAPLAAACGIYVPMISGRGLGHTGGTMDKLEAIPGYRTTPDADTFRRAVASAGCAIIGQTDDFAPADRRLYAIRDMTATVDSVPLITASILSKKLAVGLGALVMDVKVGSGAFAADQDMAADLAHSIVEVGNGAGVATTALITDMNQVLGRNAGNAVEVMEAVGYLTGAPRDARLDHVTRALTSEMLMATGMATSDKIAAVMIEDALASGAAAERFASMVAALGGPADILDSSADLPLASVRHPVLAERDGRVQAIDVAALGLAVVELGGGRRRADARIDHGVGLVDVAGIGDAVGPGGAPLATVIARDETAAARAARRIAGAVTLGDGMPEPAPAVVTRIAG
ncbi:MAG: thymidine phosphorylase [Alphaproteobacteria bacterium]|nr:thymidine phosphorylase [Alphaproteobacteria bacterium]